MSLEQLQRQQGNWKGREMQYVLANRVCKRGKACHVNRLIWNNKEKLQEEKENIVRACLYFCFLYSCSLFMRVDEVGILQESFIVLGVNFYFGYVITIHEMKVWLQEIKKEFFYLMSGLCPVFCFFFFFHSLIRAQKKEKEISIGMLPVL